MFGLSIKQKINKIISQILNSKITYIALIIIILIQFILVSIIYFQNQKLFDRTVIWLGAIEEKQSQINEQLNALNASMMRVSALMYRLQAEK